VGGQSASVQYAGSGAGMVEGVIQVNVRTPSGAPAGSAIPVALRIGGASSQTGLTVAIGP
jgi:uncharacterized protein (TIGR03437 family)